MFHKIFENKSRKYILAISGGPDSMFLLDNMRQLGYNFVVAHVNYKKRQDSDLDEKIVRDYCQNYSLVFEIKSLKETDYSPKINFQSQARQIRYVFFQKLAEKYQTKYIVTAHHYDDHLETYLLQKKKKSLVDYWGLSKKTNLDNYFILRPLLSLNKSYIYSYLSKKKISHATDFTNKLPLYQRNIIRQKLSVLNELEKENLEKEISEENKVLAVTKKTVETAIKNLIISSHNLQLDKNFEYSSEVRLRLLYYWINNATNGLLQKKKKQLLKEIYKQLFISKKKNLTIELGNNLYIFKGNNQALISPIKIYYNERKGFVKER
ncbi:MAG: tRNA(Ile)-lysidine synthase [Mycoplasmataceae bacterium]|nr:MAG: tRNA(Ile)-lysidine synthase [Mycoplasmataceae bacterium]